MSKKQKKMLNKIKVNAYKLKSNGQIPYKLYVAVLNLNYSSSIDNIIELRDMCEKYVRVGGFYIRHPEAAYECEKELIRLKIY